MVFHKKSYTFDVLFNNKDEMLDLKQLTVEVCRIATEAGHFLKEERKNFRRERVMEKHAHDYVSYVDKESEVRLVSAFCLVARSRIYYGRRLCYLSGRTLLLGH